MDLARLRGVKYLTWQDSKKVHQEDEVSECTHYHVGTFYKTKYNMFSVIVFLRVIILKWELMLNSLIIGLMLMNLKP